MQPGGHLLVVPYRGRPRWVSCEVPCIVSLYCAALNPPHGRVLPQMLPPIPRPACLVKVSAVVQRRSEADLDMYFPSGGLMQPMRGLLVQPVHGFRILAAARGAAARGLPAILEIWGLMQPMVANNHFHSPTDPVQFLTTLDFLPIAM